MFGMFLANIRGCPASRSHSKTSNQNIFLEETRRGVETIFNWNKLRKMNLIRNFSCPGEGPVEEKKLVHNRAGHIQ